MLQVIRSETLRRRWTLVGRCLSNFARRARQRRLLAESGEVGGKSGKWIQIGIRDRLGDVVAWKKDTLKFFAYLSHLAA
ncbi:hypothetical protein T12_4309 [Trichinella patagoniensis]|uniref:Uncharacterized protein n=1 Tax=Trichinella patagoniensis TaxID=990121 RepID=A0A0V1A3Y5_9BILA|nr:hypothetical protein T12_4309 [Trichinella patagoniensis]